MKQLRILAGLLVYKYSKIKKGRYVFTSFGGHYSDNTKYISKELHRKDPKAEIIWLVKDGYKKELPNYVKTCNIDSFYSYKVMGSATALIDNVYGFRALFRTTDTKLGKLRFLLQSHLLKKKGQPIFATMHGTPMKRIGRDQIGNTVYDMSCYDSYMLSGDHHSDNIYRHVTFGKMNMIVTGSPRNDILFDKKADFKDKLGLPKDKKIILFAPTFRNDGKDTAEKNINRSGIDQISQIDFNRLSKILNERFGGSWVMVCRFHYHVADMVDWDHLNNLYPGCFLSGNRGDDMAEYLASSDILITDSSASMFDYALTGKPCFLFFPDLHHYQTVERGFYLDIDKLPFPLSVDFPGLINSISSFDEQKYTIEIGNLLENLGSKNDGHSAERVVQIILEKCK